MSAAGRRRRWPSLPRLTRARVPRVSIRLERVGHALMGWPDSVHSQLYNLAASDLLAARSRASDKQRQAWLEHMDRIAHWLRWCEEALQEARLVLLDGVPRRAASNRAVIDEANRLRAIESDREGRLIELVRTDRREDFEWLARSSGVTSGQLDALWEGTRRRIGLAEAAS